MYDYVTSINSVTVTVHEDTVKNVTSYLLMSNITYLSASKPFFIVTQCCCPREKSLPLSSRTNLQVLVLVPVLGPQVLGLILEP